MLPCQSSNFGRVIVAHQKIAQAACHRLKQARVVHTLHCVKAPRRNRVRRVDVKNRLSVRLVLLD